MAGKLANSLCLWIMCFVCTTYCWNLEPLVPISCPDSEPAEGMCHTMVQQQVRCVNISIGDCDSLTGSIATHIASGICLATSFGHCTQFSCSTQCCDVNTDGYRSTCDTREGPYCDKRCENGGTCLRSVNDDIIMEECNCATPYYGDHCEKVDCGDICENGGTCTVDGSSTTCLCKPGYYGKTCSEQESDSLMFCPKPSTCNDRQDYRHHHYHRDECRSNSECSEWQLCCHDGCSRKCVQPVVCDYGGKRYREGEVITDKCKECRCHATGEVECEDTTCPTITCKNGMTAVHREESCCPVCPDNDYHKPPVFRHCRDGDTKVLPVKMFTDAGFLHDLPITAYDYKRQKLEVRFTKRYVKHCQCPMTDRPKVRVIATATDDVMATTTCSFWVLVTDPYDPVYNSCPADIFAQEGEIIEWNQPRANDNVGIRYASCDLTSGYALPVGRHSVTCDAEDYDNNKVYCLFTISVCESDALEVPPGLKSRLKKESSTVYIIASTFSAIFLIVILVFVGCMIKQRVRASQGQQTRRHRRCRVRRQGQGQAPPIHTISNPGLYTDYQTPFGVKLPPYSPPIEPPTYEEIQPRDEHLVPPAYQDAANGGAANGVSESGYLNAAYEETAQIRNQQEVPVNEEDIYSEIRLN